MKTSLITNLLVPGMMVLMAISCSTTQQATSSASPKAPKEQPAYRELIDILSKEPGLDVKKVGSTYDITIRGKQTFNTGHQPLYVLDGMVIGTSYEDAAGSINIVDVASVNVLKGSEATSYGSRGANGVIEIRLKRGPKQ
ncbi:MAG: TonB-dependent receptor plug domain-containing protein [Saprospiraceae bacterium]|nr:TonB-dependent receptor plug domain-containing protein [Saprospiraceae bacterium]